MKEKSFCQMEFKCDQEGKEILLKDGKFQVMMEWERPYMQACIDALKPSGDVLEVGFGCGYASTHIQTFRPKSHTIIEYHPTVAIKARQWAEKYSHVTIIEDTWQNALKSLGQFDAIFFDDYPLENEEEGKKILESKKKAHAVLEKGKKTLQEVYERLPVLRTITYTEKDIEDFFILAERQAPEVFLRFFFDMKRDGHIDENLYHYALKRLLEQKIITPEALEEFLKKAPSSPFLFRHQGDRLLAFLQLCLQNHMRPGAVFSCFLEDASSKFEDENFFNQIITNPYLEYKEEWIPVQVPAHCNYYKDDKALVMTIRRL